MKLLNIEEENSQRYYTAYLNNVRCMIKIFDKLLQKQAFILLPGDEIVEKKHGNIKILTAQKESADLSKRATRKWPGLGPNVFEINYAQLFDAYKDFGHSAEEEKSGEPAAENEISGEVEVMNTQQHKSIVKARNEFYKVYK